MDIYTLGNAPDIIDILALPAGVEIKSYSPDTPLFDVDGLMFFQGADAGARELFLRSGRPVIDFGKERFDPNQLKRVYVGQLADKERTNYQPIDCNFYDNFEAAIVTRRVVDLVYLDPFGEEVVAATKLKDLKTKLTEEFIQLESSEWLRLDRIVSVDGEAAGASCRF